MVKPDGVERRLVGEIVGRLERKGLRVAAADLRTLDAATAEHHYADHVGKPYYEALVEFIISGPVFVMVRSLMGDTNSNEAAPGTIRGDLGSDLRENLIHGSDSAESARREIEIFFPHQA
jgi:nucleoside-diphosphate kinase